MLTQMLVSAGKQAMYSRNQDGEGSTEHKEAADKIEEITRHLRAQNPEKYWVDGSKEYRALTDKWGAAREAREALAKASAK